MFYVFEKCVTGYSTAKLYRTVSLSPKILCALNSSLPPSNALTNTDHFTFSIVLLSPEYDTIGIIQNAVFSGRILLLSNMQLLDNIVLFSAE